MVKETRMRLLAGVSVVIALITGLTVGYFAAHRDGGGVSAPQGRVGAMNGMSGASALKDMPGMDMKEMARPSAPIAPPGAVVIPAAQRQLIGVKTSPVKNALMGQEIRAVGTVVYDERKLTQVNLRVSGWIKDVFVDSVGKPVRKGDPLLSVYSPDLLATQDEYLLALRSQAQLAGSPMPEAKEGAAALVASAHARLTLWNLTDRQIAELERRGKSEPVMMLYAPSSGVVLKREALPGRYAEPGTMLYEIADLSTVWIYADVYESQMAGVKLHQPANVTLEAYPGETFHGTVGYIYPSVNETTRTARLRVELPNPGMKLKPGMYGSVILDTDAKDRLVVPKEAVLDTGLRQLVFVDRGEGVYMPTNVKVGRRSEDAIEILNGLKEGEHVVTSANFMLDAESKLASTGNMQQMMGQIGMADWQMRGAYEAKMGGTDGMDGMKGMDMGKGRAGEMDMTDMPGMAGQPKAVSETRKVGGYALTLITVPAVPKSGENLLRLKIAGPDGKPIANAQVVFIYTMPMPGMTDTKVPAAYSDGFYEGKTMLGMSGTWNVTANVTIPGKPPIVEKFTIQVSGGM